MGEVEKVKATVDIKLSKDDIFNVVVSEKEAGIESLVEKENIILKKLKDERFNSRERLVALIAEEYKSDNVTVGYSFTDAKERKYFEVYNIDSLVKLKRPHLSANKFKSSSVTLMKLREDTSVILKKNFDLDGYTGSLSKSVSVGDFPASLIKDLEANFKSHFKIECEYMKQLVLVKNLEYDLLTLDNTHRKIKAEIAKKFIPSKDLKSLLTLKK